MFKVLFFSILVIILSLTAGWVGTKPGSIQVYWLGYNISTSISVAFILMLIVIFLSLILYNIILSIVKTKNKIKSNIISKREDRSINSLSRGIVALISGDGEMAEKLSNDTKNIPKILSPLKILLSAHSAHLNNNKKTATSFFEEMLDYKELEFLGLRGLMLQAKSEDERIKYARRAYLINPRSKWVFNNLFKLEAKLGNWREVEQILRSYKKNGGREIVNIDRKISISMFEQAKNYNQEDYIAKLKKFSEAYELSSEIVPLALELSKLYLVRGRIRKANRILEKSWKLNPHPDLFELFKKIHKSDSRDKFSRRTFKLSESFDNSDVEVCLSKAEVLYLSKNYTSARELLNNLIEKIPDKRGYALMAKIEEQEKGPLASKPWYEEKQKLLLPLWVCDSCGFSSNNWLPLCSKCSSFDSFSWGYNRYDNIQSIELKEESIIEENMFDKSI